MTKRIKSVFTQDVEGLEDTVLPLHVRVQGRVRAAILNGSFGAGIKLSSSRVLARDLKVSRHTVEWAFQDLEAEGFIVRRPGVGTFVADAIPQREQSPSGTRQGRVFAAVEPSRRVRALGPFKGQTAPVNARVFVPSLPAVDLFPRRIWAKLAARTLLRRDFGYWTYGASAGLPELRRAVAAHVAATRGVNCTMDQVIVVTSTQQAIDLAARVLCDHGDTAWFEEPGYPVVRHLLQSAGLQVVPVPVDHDGFDLKGALRKSPRAKLAYVTPSHQYPTGVLMTLPRRLALLEWARTHSGWILEDDYDGDFRYEGRPLAALQALDSADRVVYIGTFSKMTFPALRLSYLIVPPALVELFDMMKHLVDGFTALPTQATLAEFIDSGHLAVHVRHMLREYDKRRLALVAALSPMADLLELGPTDAGLHLAAYFRGTLDDRRVKQACAQRGIGIQALSSNYANTPRHGLLLGFACATPEQIVRGTATLRAVLLDRKTTRLERQ